MDAQIKYSMCILDCYHLQFQHFVAKAFPSKVLQGLLASPAADTFQQGILAQLTCVNKQ